MCMLTPRYRDALELMFALPGEQTRKNFQRTPFISHLMSVSALVLEDGGNEDEAIAALLHDAIEDAGGVGAELLIVERLGIRVAEIVRGVSDTDISPKPPWRQRKLAYIEHLDHADQSMLRVSCADKIHNLRSLRTDLRLHGERHWQIFSAPKADQLWVYGAYTEAFERNFPGQLAEQLRSEYDGLLEDLATRIVASL
jgi:(p)ppGpp synthase/HD superfamily hydrolase